MIEEYEVPTLDGSWRIDTMQGFWKPVRGWRGDDSALPPFRCYWHERWEYSPHWPYIVCFECGHVYPTEDSLIEAQREKVDYFKSVDLVHFGHVVYAQSADEITFCQHCLHDF